MARLSEALLISLWALAFAVAGAWSHISGAPFPLPGLRRLAESDGFAVILQVAAVVGGAVWLGYRDWQTRERLLIFQGMSVALLLQGFLYIGVPFGLAFACFAGIAARRVAKQASELAG